MSGAAPPRRGRSVPGRSRQAGTLVRFWQLYGRPEAAWLAARKAWAILRQGGARQLAAAARAKAAHPTLTVAHALRQGTAHPLAFDPAHPAPAAGLAARHSVCIVVPTKGNQPLVDALLHSLVRSLQPRDRVEVQIVNNGPPLTLPSPYPFPLQLVREERPFNWSAYNNAAAARTQAEFLLLLNDDVRAIHRGWLDAMLQAALQPGVGAVGAKLLYPDGTIQHAGIALDRAGNPLHRLRGQPRQAAPPGVQPVAAVTGACLLTRRELLGAQGGFDERFAFSYNDVVYCLRLGAAGLQSVVTTWAELVHEESATRPLRVDPREKALLAAELARWRLGGSSRAEGI